MKDMLVELFAKADIKISYEYGSLNLNLSVGEFKMIYSYVFRHAQTEQKLASKYAENGNK